VKRQFHLLAQFSLILLSSIMSFDAIGQSAQTPTQAEVPQGVPRLVKFGGLLKDASGTLLTNTVGITFAVYSEQTGGGPLWQETQNVQFSQGRYTVLLGESASTGIPAELFASGQPRWLGIRALLPGEEEQPRVLLASVPYALKAADADTLGGLPASAFMQTNGNNSSTMVMAPVAAAGSTKDSVRAATSSTVTTSSGTLGTIPYFSTSTDIESSAMTYSAATGVVGVRNLENTLYADPFCPTTGSNAGCAQDVGVAINAAISALPTLNGTKTGIVSLNGFQGTVPLTTTIQLSGHSVNLIGPGKTVLTLDCKVPASSDCIFQNDLNWASGNFIDGPRISGLSLDGEHNSNTSVNAIHVRDTFRLHIDDVMIFGFSASGDRGLYFDNKLHFTEQLQLSHVQLAKNAIGAEYTTANVTTGGQSYGYGSYDQVIFQPEAGHVPAQIGVQLDGGSSNTTLPLIYHSKINWIFEDLDSTPGTIEYLVMANNSTMVDNTYDIFMEDQESLGAVGLTMGTQSSITGFGDWQMWLFTNNGMNNNMNIAGTACGKTFNPCTFTGGSSGAAFQVAGRVDANGLVWSSVNGNIVPLGAGGWGTDATVINVQGQWQNFTFTIQTGSCVGGCGANPTVQINLPNLSGSFANPIFRNTPSYTCKNVGGGTGAINPVTAETMSSTNFTFIWNGTPTASKLYVIACQGGGR
jgi:hypothetical protein